MSKGGSGDEFELKPVDGQAESEARAQQPLGEELDISFEPVAEPAAQPAEVPPEPTSVAPPVGQSADDAEISAEQFVAGAEQEPLFREETGIVQPVQGEGELAAAQPEPAAAEGQVGLEEFKPAEAEAAEEEKKEEEKEEEEEARPSIFARIAEASPYTVLLGAAFLALVIGIVFLLLELKTYDFDIRAKKARQGVMDRPAATSSYQRGIV